MPIFTDNASASIGAWGENQFLRHIRDWLGDTAPAAPSGMGDDCSVTPLEGCNLLTTDSLLYGRHFDQHLPAEWAGMKLMNRNISDIAAMGGLPRFALLSGCFPAQTDQRWMEAFVAGLAKAARNHGIQILGGDLAQTDKEWMATVTLIGNAESPLLRSGGSAGDSIWVTGALGGSILGRHARFEPRIEEGRLLAHSGRVKAAMDLSDGLAKDLPALIGHGLCAVIDPAAIPIHSDALRLSKESGRPPVEHAACDGEDYELLFTVDKSVSEEDWQSAWSKSLKTPLHRIGRIETLAGQAPLIDAKTRQPFSWSDGYQHFR
ncbi:MAG: thiamine-monophosphate kinase [Opitutales bacterium]|nr:thiamine-monophosphate kinase [Opitutales bacterium]